MNAEDKKERIRILTDIGLEVEQQLTDRHDREGAPAGEICFEADRVPEMVDDYEAHLADFKGFHGFETDKRAEADKISGLTAILLMRHWLFISSTNSVNMRHRLGNIRLPLISDEGPKRL